MNTGEFLILAVLGAGCSVASADPSPTVNPPVHVVYSAALSPITSDVVARLRPVGAAVAVVDGNADVLDVWDAVDGKLADGIIPVVVGSSDLARAIAQGRQVPFADTSHAGEALARAQLAMSGPAPDSVAVTRAGDGTAATPYRMPLPVADIVDTRGHALITACNDEMRGVAIEVAVPAARTLAVRVLGRAEAIAVEQGGACLADGMRQVDVPVAAGTVRIVIRGGKGESIVTVK